MRVAAARASNVCLWGTNRTCPTRLTMSVEAGKADLADVMIQTAKVTASPHRRGFAFLC